MLFIIIYMYTTIVWYIFTKLHLNYINNYYLYKLITKTSVSYKM